MSERPEVQINDNSAPKNRGQNVLTPETDWQQVDSKMQGSALALAAEQVPSMQVTVAGKPIHGQRADEDSNPNLSEQNKGKPEEKESKSAQEIWNNLKKTSNTLATWKNLNAAEREAASSLAQGIVTGSSDLVSTTASKLKILSEEGQKRATDAVNDLLKSYDIETKYNNLNGQLNIGYPDMKNPDLGLHDWITVREPSGVAVLKDIEEKEKQEVGTKLGELSKLIADGKLPLAKPAVAGQEKNKTQTEMAQSSGSGDTAKVPGTEAANQMDAPKTPLGVKLQKMLGNDKEKTFANGLKIKRESESSYSIEIPGASPKYVDVNSKAIKDASGKVLGVVSLDKNDELGLYLREGSTKIGIKSDGLVTVNELSRSRQIEYPAHGKWRKTTQERGGETEETLDRLKVKKGEKVSVNEGTSVTFGNGMFEMERNGQTWAAQAYDTDLTIKTKDGAEKKLIAEKDAKKTYSGRSGSAYTYPDGSNVYIDNNGELMLTLPEHNGVEVRVSNYSGTINGAEIRIVTSRKQTKAR